MSTSARVQKLRLLIGGLEEPQGREFIQAPGLPQGLARGLIVELLGPSKAEWLVQLLKLHPEFRTFWAESEQRILPTSLHQRGVDLTQITFAVIPGDLLTTLRRVIQSQLYTFVIAPSQFGEIKILKALQIFTEKSNGILFLLGTQKPRIAWPISLQLEISKGLESDFAIQILKQKQGREFV